MKKSKTFLTAAVLGTAFCSSSGMQASENPVPAYEAPDAVFTATGTVVDANGEPVIGATVREKGKPTNGCSTDVDGNYTLKVRKGAKLEISYVGCVTATIDAGKGMSTTLQDDAKVLDDVVVVGFGTQKKANLTGAVAVASGKEIENRPVRNRRRGLQGLLPGLQLTREV